ncbi:hypothetical protein K438DRAFT_2132518, partial [Mycena galopus ATCC 62051]
NDSGTHSIQAVAYCLEDFKRLEVYLRGRWSLTFWRNHGTFVREGNIYDDGKADRFEVPCAVECCRDIKAVTWISSSKAIQGDASLSACGVHPLIGKCEATAAFEFKSGRGAVLAMENETITSINPPGALRRLLKDPSMRGMLIVSEVHSCTPAPLMPVFSAPMEPVP